MIASPPFGKYILVSRNKNNREKSYKVKNTNMYSHRVAIDITEDDINIFIASNVFHLFQI